MKCGDLFPGVADKFKIWKAEFVLIFDENSSVEPLQADLPRNWVEKKLMLWMWDTFAVLKE